MKVVMKVTKKYPGITYEAGSTYDVADPIAKEFIAQGIAAKAPSRSSKKEEQ
ncbi:hypothetical protein ACM66T_10215 [Sulfurimonas sp. ST-25]|uniref:hypothetical protein n=1 Tax=Sulfurimonas sp. ST-25 TaxID=3400151 RepID=UPI003A886CAB